MKIIHSLLLGGLIAICLPGFAAPQEGRPAPRAQLTTLEGQRIDTQALRGRVVVINFWATWCTYCREELADLDRFQRRYGSQGLDVISINLDDDEKLPEVRRLAAGLGFPVALKQAAEVRGYGRIWRLPLTFVIDRRGILRRDGWDSEPAVSYKLLEQVLLPLLQEPA